MFVKNCCVTTIVVNGYTTCIFNVTAIANKVANETCFACVAIFPNCTISQAQKHFAIGAVTIPITAFAIDVYIYRTTGIAFPMRTVFNPKVYRTKLTRSYTITIIIGILAVPVRIFTSETYTDLAFSTHTAISYEITSDSSFSITCTSNITIFIFSNIHIYDAGIVRSKFTISTNSCPRTVFSFNITATDFNSRRYRADCFVGTFVFISNNINHAIDDDFRFNARCTVHCFDYCTIICIACTCASNDRTTITIVNINFTATISEDGSSLSTTSCCCSNISRVIDFNNTFINCRNAGAVGICSCINYKLIIV